MKTFLRKAVSYYKKNGFVKMVKRIPVKLRWTIFRKRDIVYMCELAKFDPGTVRLPENTVVQKRTGIDQITGGEFQALCRDRDAAVFREQLKERFRKGSVLWLIKYQDKTAGMFWTIKGTTIRPHYFCLMENDVHLYDGEILPEYRGLGLFGALTNDMLLELKKAGLSRAYVETNAANTAAIRAFDKINLKKTATARKFRLFGRNITIWNKEEKEL